MTTITVNMKDILLGKIKRLPIALEQDEKVDFARSLVDALGMYYDEFPGWLENICRKETHVHSTGFWKQEYEVTIRDVHLLPKELLEANDNFLTFLLDNDFDVDILIMAMAYALRIKGVEFDAETDAFGRYFDRIVDMMISSDNDFIPVKKTDDA